MNRLPFWLADLLSPFYRSPISFPENELRGFHRGNVFRSAELSTEFPFGIFEVIGLKYAEHVRFVWRPHEIHLLEDVSLAFYEIDHRADEHIAIPDVHIQRLIDSLMRYFQYLGEQKKAIELKHQIAHFIQERRNDTTIGGQL